MSTNKDSASSTSSQIETLETEDKKTVPSSPAPAAENIKKPTSSSVTDEQPDKIEALRRYLEKLGLKLSGSDNSVDEKKTKTKVLETLDFDGLIKHWKKVGFKNIITMVGAGISTSAGIPDFRSPGSGLYNNLQKYNLPTPSAIFQLNYFRHNPKPFFALAKELYPGCFKPTPCHYFIKMLDEKGLLLRHYTQNIDTLERVAGINGDKMVEAHGTFYTNHCIKCKKYYSMEWAKEKIFLDEIPRCICGNIVKPDIVFFGENLPDKFYKLPDKDFKKCDLLIIMGTSLEVQPFASLIERTNENCVRLLINREIVGRVNDDFVVGDGFYFGMEDNTRDIALIGDCDDGVKKIAKALGFEEELTKLIEDEYKKIDEENKI